VFFFFFFAEDMFYEKKVCEKTIGHTAH